ncbi:hypothetical protein DdX_01218 [Ditylenchus destructor]|uniref:Uncharacterized protein n=1 Tax=Ditylenchus destructor TaxID=166010 RepID=A0AAD4R7X3_9BILA|nr:hypothetical protein DdX_01218 [Ditylenchus destructor]
MQRIILNIQHHFDCIFSPRSCSFAACKSTPDGSPSNITVKDSCEINGDYVQGVGEFARAAVVSRTYPPPRFSPGWIAAGRAQ